jgi:predicted enzyme related to lactoylglutathione lyase
MSRPGDGRPTGPGAPALTPPAARTTARHSPALPGTDLDAGPVGLGVSLSLSADDSQAPHDQLRGYGVPILMDPFDTPFGRTFVFQDPDGYAIAIHGVPPAPAA